MPPPATAATHLLPSADPATALHLAAGAPVSAQLAPESAEFRIEPPLPDAETSLALINLVPSAEEAT